MVKSSETERKERMDTSSLMEQILSSDNLNRAYLQVVRNKGAQKSGRNQVHGTPRTSARKNGEIIKRNDLRTKKEYKPQPVRSGDTKPDGGVRNHNFSSSNEQNSYSKPFTGDNTNLRGTIP